MEGCRHHFPTLIRVRLLRDEMRSKRLSDFVGPMSDCDLLRQRTYVRFIFPTLIRLNIQAQVLDTTAMPGVIEELRGLVARSL